MHRLLWRAIFPIAPNTRLSENSSSNSAVFVSLSGRSRSRLCRTLPTCSITSRALLCRLERCSSVAHCTEFKKDLGHLGGVSSVGSAAFVVVMARVRGTGALRRVCYTSSRAKPKLLLESSSRSRNSGEDRGTCSPTQVHACACTCKHGHACACMRMQVHAGACMCMHVHACACRCMQVHACACMCMHAHACACMRACMCMHVHACACMCMHVHACACIPAGNQARVGVWNEPKIGVLADSQKPRLILSRAGLTAVRDKINL